MRETGRRRFLQRAAAAGAFTVLASCDVAPRPAKRIPRVGYIAGFHDPATDPAIEAFRDALPDHGYTLGKTILFELRYGEGDRERYDAYANELVAMPVDVLASSNFDALNAMRRATSTIPIVMTYFPDPVAAGMVQSLAKPGGNVTGMGVQPAGTITKRLELLTEAFPGVSRVAALWDGTQPRLPTVRATEEAARRLRVDLLTLEVGAEAASSALSRALDRATAEAADALLLLPSQIHMVMLRKEIIRYAAARRIPSSFPSFGGYVEDGGLMAYGENFVDTFRRAASYVDRILKGANPAELPVEQPTKFDLLINLKTARELGFTIPQSVLSRATKVIQ